MQSSKLAVALSGGGFTGYLFEIGGLTAFDDLFDDGFTINDFDLFIGVSAGSAAAALLANGVRPEELLEANLSEARPYYFERRDIFVPAMGDGLKTVLRVGQQLIPLLKQYYQNRHEMTLLDLLDQAQDALPSGIYTLEPFARYLEATFAGKGLSNSFEGLRKELYIPAIDLENGQSVIFGDEGWRQVPISRAVTASSAAPIYFSPVRIQGRDYIDAGVGKIPLMEVAAQKGVDFVVILNPCVPIRNDLTAGRNKHRGKRPVRIRDKGFLSIGEQASRINLEARFSQSLALFRESHPKTEFFMIAPKPTVTLLFERSFLSFRDRVHLLRCGYLSAAKLIKQHFGLLRSRFARNGIPLSLARFEEQLRMRMGQLEGSTALPHQTSVSFGERIGWSSAVPSSGNRSKPLS